MLQDVMRHLKMMHRNHCEKILQDREDDRVAAARIDPDTSAADKKRHVNL